MKFIITESQYNILNEAVGVPDDILDAAEKLYQIVEDHTKSINDKSEEYVFDGVLDVEIGGKKKIKINNYTLTINAEHFDGYNDKPQIISMAVSASFGFDRDKMIKVQEKSKHLDLSLTFAVSEDWVPYELYEALEKDKTFQIASLAHELKHKYDKQVKQMGLVGDDAEYQAVQRKDNFGIPVIDNEFFRNMYFVSMVENLVRPTEVASQMRTMGISKNNFMEFLENERVYKELLEIRDFTFDHFISELKKQMSRIDRLLEYIGEDPEEMTEDEKINRVLELVYISIVNKRMDLFVDMTSKTVDDIIELGRGLGILPDYLSNEVEGLKRVNELRQKYLNYTKRFKDNPTKFFEEECKKFNRVAGQMLKKIGKLYSIAKNDDPVSESIQNWELHQQLMEKKFGKRKIETKIRYKY